MSTHRPSKKPSTSRFECSVPCSCRTFGRMFYRMFYRMFCLKFDVSSASAASPSRRRCRHGSTISLSSHRCSSISASHISIAHVDTHVHTHAHIYTYANYTCPWHVYGLWMGRYVKEAVDSKDRGLRRHLRRMLENEREGVSKHMPIHTAIRPPPHMSVPVPMRILCVYAI